MILVTGVTGFVGGHALRAWSELPQRPPLRVLVREPGRLGTVPEGVEVVSGDLCDPQSLKRAVRGATGVLHLASKTIDRDGSGFEVNVAGTTELARHARAAGVCRFSMLSSVGVYGHGLHRDADEDTPLRPDTPLAHSRAEAERAVAEHFGEVGGIATIVRPRFVVGEGDRHVLPRMIRAARRAPILVSGGRARLSFIEAGDLARALWGLLLHEQLPAGTAAFHATDGVPICFRDLSRLLCDTFGGRPARASVPFPVLYRALRLRERLAGVDPETASTSFTSIRVQLVGQDGCFSNDRLRRVLPDWKPSPLRQALPGLVAHYRAQLADSAG